MKKSNRIKRKMKHPYLMITNMGLRIYALDEIKNRIRHAK